MSGAKKKLWRSVPKRDDDRIKVRKWLQRGVEKASETHVRDFHPTTFFALAHDEYICRF
jgi:hypothetical protein